MEIEKMRILCKDETIQMTEHVYKRCRERGISFEEIKHCILHGEVIEDYPNDYPYPSSLILEYKTHNSIHVVAGMSDKHLWIITAYHPDLMNWENDFKTRKEKLQ